MRNGYGHMVLDHMIDRVRAKDAERAERLACLTTLEEAKNYQHRVRQAIASAFVPVPPKTPLNARVTGRVERSGYAIEKVIFESRPGCLVTANLYIPDRLAGPAPCVLGSCGHTPNGKAGGQYQGFCQRLALNGFIVLIYDPFNQGERDQYALLEGCEEVRQSTFAHNMMGKQLELVGENFPMWRAWDGVRALDYLLSRPEVDSSRVGLTGNSGGGTLATWLWAIDDRFTMAAPNCFVTTFLHNLENELPADAEQYPLGVIGAGLEMADFLIAAAPKPVILTGEHYDFFDRRGHQQAYEQVRDFYSVWGAPPANVDCFRAYNPHSYTPECQTAMVEFFAKHAGLKAHVIEKTEVLEDAKLWCTPEGEVMRAGSRPIFSFIAERARALATDREALGATALAQRLRELLHLPGDWTVPHYRNLRPVRWDEMTCGRYAVETEADIRAILHKRMAHPERVHALDVEKAVRLYIAHFSAEHELADDPWAIELQTEGELYALDVRGLGESAPDESTSFWHPYSLDYMMHGYYLMLGESYMGRRVWDVLRTISLLADMGAEEIDVYGKCQGALLAMFAAVLDSRITHVTMKNAPRSFEEWATTPVVDWPAANVIPGVLEALDVSDCVHVLGERATVIEPCGPQMQL